MQDTGKLEENRENSSSPQKEIQKSIIRHKEERFSSLSHLFGVFLSICGFFLLMIRIQAKFAPILIICVYFLSNIFLFFSSFLYHARKQEEDEISVFRKLDHIAIYVMIAGTYTPFCYLFLSGGWFWVIFISQWVSVIAGIAFKLFFLNTPRWITSGIYLIQGWMAVLPLYQFWTIMTRSSFFLLVAGGISYTIGAIIYILKKPNPIPKYFGFHEIFHVFILIGACLHFFIIYQNFL